ncbi:MAG: selenocysteine-specific translation elongation factor [Verrucomicrobiales bacterium]|nr:selenocysteine-specific translation elongation factor [Verrucomicrobiales bacterium]
MSDRHFIIGTAGHIDHGKSSLIEALTGTDPDRLPEEKARGMTIELGFAQLTIPSVANPDDSLALGVIDVPGHSDFVKNMVAGVGSLDLAIFIVAADDGWMPQTEEHYQILQYLNVERAIVALTKVDLTDELELVLEDVRENLIGGPWENVDVLPVSSHTGEGIDELRKKIAEILDASPPVSNSGKPRLPVDRAFSLKGIGTVVAGTLIDGSLEVGTELVVQPAGVAAHIRTAQSHGKNVDEVPPGTRTAVNLSGISVREPKSTGKEVVGRGDILTLPSLGESVMAIDVLITKSDRDIRGIKQSTKPMKTGREVMFHYGSSGRRARIHFLGQKSLEPGSSTLAEVRFYEPVYVFVGDRFVLRDASLGATLAGGIVLDEDANRRAFRKEFQGTFLEERRNHVDNIEVLVRTQMVRDKAVFLPTLLAKSRFSAAKIREVAEKLVAEGDLEQSGDWVFEADWWRQVSGIAAAKIDDIHRDHPDHLGLPLRELRAMMEPELPSPKFFDQLLSGLLAGNYSKAGPNIRRTDHIPILPPELEKAGELVRRRVLSDLISPPNKGETATCPAEEKALRFLTHTGEVVDLDPKTVISSKGFELVKDQIVAFLEEHGRATASELRQHTGTVRRILMPLLEKLDEDGVTRRDGDYRYLKQV